MPDENKFKALREAGYKIPVVCGLCKYGPTGPAQWGECGLHKYVHLRQSSPDGGRGVSVHVYGTCDYAEIDYARIGLLQAHTEFLPE